MMCTKDLEIFYPIDVPAWRQWLVENHSSKKSVWLVLHKQKSGKKSITWREAVDVALCFGWIDSKKIKVDEDTSHQFFSKRKPISTWSKINKEKISQLIESGLMQEAGFKAIDTAKQNGSWTMLDEVEELVIPEDLQKAFDKQLGSEDFFIGLSRSAKKAILQWLMFARKPETRQKRIKEIAASAALGFKPEQFR